ncbi:MAG: DNA polymerase III subunit alpha [Proteobacteria bacterium]|nr:DNA polymerase III subunit alpha [Pseudomonadota bacterium]MCL2307724.1 DNA polymerase III subunit alpha [Pseudomonadota bacterium]
MTAAIPRFVHLRCHSEFSIVDGILRIDEAVAAAEADAMPALALTDLNNLFGLIKFYKVARKAGIKPIVGADIGFVQKKPRAAPHRMLLLAQSRTGYLNLCTLLTRAYQAQEAHQGKIGVAPEWLREHHEGLLLITGARGSEIGEALLQGDVEAAEISARAWARAFPDRFYLEVQRAGHADDDLLVAACADLARRLDLPLVATHPVQFKTRSDFRAHDARVCISEGYTLSDTRRPQRFTQEQYFTTQDEMAEKFADLPEALANTVEIAQRCNLTIPLGKPHLPVFPTPEGMSVDVFLKAQAAEGLERRLRELFPNETQREAKRAEYQARLDFELETIIQMGFPGYFLIVADFINWAKANDVPVGPGRGSGAGSLVAYSLGITDLDPLRYALLFERFLNPERVSMPDFDIDFCQDKRERVIEYVRHKYGSDSVSQIATFGTMAAKAVVRDVGRVLDLPYSFCDSIAKLIPFNPGNKITLAEAREAEPLLAEREKNEEEVRELLALAEPLEGLTRNVGMHAGGVLIAPGKLTDFCPLFIQPDADTAVSQFDKDDVEAAGLVKFDFLGLATLTVLDWTLKFIRKRDPAFSVTLKELPLDDKATYDIFRKGNTTAVFQFESRGMRELLVRAHPDQFEDLIALVALYRPGPMDLIPDYIERKHGARIDYLDDRLKTILGPTYGIMVYQEQVMQIAQMIGGYSLGGADLLRRAMGKKNVEEMAEQRSIFVSGAENNGTPLKNAHLLFDLMEKFAGYGFNKSHAAAYALVAYQTAYFKAHHVAAFMAANLSLVMHDTDKVRIFYDDALAQGLTILPPDINASTWRFEPIDKHTLRFGLGAIKGAGEYAIDHVVAERDAGGAFTDLFDFCKRVDRHQVNRRVIEGLVRGGAFDLLNDNRAALLASVPAIMDAAEQACAHAAQVALFSDDVLPYHHALADVLPWPEAERLAQEKSVLGFYLSGHPFLQYKEELSSLVAAPLDRLKPQQERILIAGIITTIRAQSSKRGKMAFVTLDDSAGSVEIVVYSETFEAARALLQEDRLIIADVRISHRHQERDGEDAQSSLRIIADAFYDLDTLRRTRVKALRISCNAEANAKTLLEILRPFAGKNGGGVPVMIDYANTQASGVVALPDLWRIAPEEALIQHLHTLPGVTAARFAY